MTFKEFTKTSDYLLADLIEIIDERGVDINDPENTLSDRQILKIAPSQATGIIYIILKNE